VSVFLDSNVFLYAAGAPHPMKRPCRDLVNAVAAGRLDAATSCEVLQEVLHVLSRRGSRAQGLVLVRHILALLGEVYPIRESDIRASLDLARKYPSLPVRDALHAAVMSNCGIRDIVSADVHFDQVAGVRRLDPSVAVGLASSE